MFIPNYAKSDVASSQTDSALISAKVGVVNRIIGGFIIVAGTATNVTLNSKGTGAGTSITSTLPCGINGGISWPIAAQQNTGDPPFGYFESARGEGITVTTGAGASVIGVNLTYIQI